VPTSDQKAWGWETICPYIPCSHNSYIGSHSLSARLNNVLVLCPSQYDVRHDTLIIYTHNRPVRCIIEIYLCHAFVTSVVCTLRSIRDLEDTTASTLLRYSSMNYGYSENSSLFSVTVLQQISSYDMRLSMSQYDCVMLSLVQQI
jgi:hypothetical protein